MANFQIEPATLKVENLSITRGNNLLFENFSLTVEPCNLLWVCGDNGIGKTSLLKCLAGLLRPTAGSVLWDDRPPVTVQYRNVAYQGHQDCLKSTLTVQENLLYWRACYGSTANIADMLERFNLSQLSTSKAVSLSAGQARRLSLARLQIKSAPLWILDEPGACMDKTGTTLINTLIGEQLKVGGAVIVASHGEPENLHTQTRILRFSGAQT